MAHTTTRPPLPDDCVTFAEGMTCGHLLSELVRSEDLGTWAPREVYRCATPGCPTPEFKIDLMREAESCGFAPEDDEDWD